MLDERLEKYRVFFFFKDANILFSKSDNWSGHLSGTGRGLKGESQEVGSDASLAHHGSSALGGLGLLLCEMGRWPQYL